MAVWKQNRSDLGQFLRSRRERIKPAEFGLPAGPRRRARGLRREEVAVLAGLSPTWYTYLEQGRDIRASPEVLESLVRVLHLNEDERRYLYLLAQERNPPLRREEPQHVGVTGHVGGTVDDVISVVRDVEQPVYIGNLYGDVLVWNNAFTHWYADFAQLPDNRRNMLWWLVTDPVAPVRLVNWAEDARDVTARFRLAAASRPYDRRFRELFDAAWDVSRDFRRWWSAHEVTDTHPRVWRMRSVDGQVQDFSVIVLRMADGLNSVVLHVPVPATGQ